jgi:hypothetical protein
MLAIYASFEILILSLFLLQKRYRKYFLILLYLFIIVLFLGLKEGNYYDFINYKKMFYNASISTIPLYPEISYIFLSVFFKSLGLDFYFLTLTYYTLLAIFLYKAISISTTHREIAFLYFILFPIFFLSGYIAMRQIVAISIFFYSILYLNQKRKFPFLFILMACLFHYSTILAYSIYFIFHKAINKKFKMYIYFLFIVIAIGFSFYFNKLVFLIFSFFPPFLKRYIHYLLLDHEIQVLRMIFYSFLYFLILILFNYTKENNETMNNMFNLYTIGTIISLAGMTDMNVNRFANFFLIFIITLLPNLLFSKNRISRNTRVITFYMLTLLLSIYYYTGILRKPDIFLTYQNILFK